MSLRALPANFPGDIAVLRRAPYEARADAVMYRRVLVLGDRTDAMLDGGPRSTLGPPWTKDHRTALAATVVSV